jgi:type IV secretion system protein VirB8
MEQGRVMQGRKVSTAKVDEAVTRSVNFEVTVADLAKRNERRAWWVAGAAIVMALILACGCFYMLPLKQKVPYLVMADAYTGTSTVARLVPGPAYQRITSSEAINRSNVAHYVLARESYDLTLLNLRDWNTVMTMSSPGVAASYRALYSSLNESSPYRVYGRERSIRVKILSIVLIGGGRGKTPTGATVRFQKSVYVKQSGATQPLDNKIATMAFTYNPDLKMQDSYRIDNPLGFTVTDYRVDNDYDSTPPMAVAAQVAASNRLPNASSGNPPGTQGQAGTPPEAASTAMPPPLFDGERKASTSANPVAAAAKSANKAGRQ